MTTDLYEHYRAVLDDLGRQRTGLLSKVQELDAAITAIHKQLPSSSPLFRQSQADTHPGAGYSFLAAPPLPLVSASKRFSKISVRWASIWHLSDATAPQKTGDVATAILNGGYVYGGKTFVNSVSAVLSAMKAKDEVESVGDSGYVLTQNGRSAWEAIKNSVKFKDATQGLA